MKGINKRMIYVLFIIYVLFSASGLVLFKSGAEESAVLSIFGFSITFKMILGIVFYGVSFLLWLYIVIKLNLTFAMPLSVALVNLLVIIESCLILKEKVSVKQGIGIFIILIGVIIVTGGKNA